MSLPNITVVLISHDCRSFYPPQAEGPSQCRTSDHLTLLVKDRLAVSFLKALLCEEGHATMAFPLYSSLSKGQFRLLEVLPGHSSEPICRLFTHQLGQSPDYTAISYAWGDENITQPIFVDGRRVYIRRNLFDVLKALRLERDSRTIWADAICINQENEDERAEQVALMGEIFSACADCIIWAGFLNVPDTELMRPAGIPEGLMRLLDDHIVISKPDIEAVVDLLNALRTLREHYVSEDEMHAMASSSNRPEDDSRKGHDNEQLKQDLAFYCTKRAVSSLMNILRRPWWSRVWVLQEALLPRQRYKPVNIWLGSESIKLDTFLLGSDGWDEKCTEFLVHTLQHTQSNHLRTVLMPGLILLSSLSHLERSMRGGSDGRQVLDVYWAFLYSVADRKCTNPRDFIYGLHGLINGSDTLGTPDYSSTVDQCYIQATRCFITNTLSLRHLMFVNPARRLISDLPSWVLDYSGITSFMSHWIWRRRFHEEWQTGGHEERDSSADVASLKVQGVRLTAVKDVAPMSRWECGEESCFPLVMSWYTLASGMGVTNTEFLRTLFHFSSTTSDADDILLRDFVDSRDFHKATNLADFSEGFFSAGSSFCSSDEMETASTAYQARAVRRLTTMYHAKVAFATLEDGRIGLVYECVQPGDMVVMLKGISEPVILRPRPTTAYLDNNNSRADVLSYRFLGICITSRPLGKTELQKLDWQELELT